MVSVQREGDVESTCFFPNEVLYSDRSPSVRYSGSKGGTTNSFLEALLELNLEGETFRNYYEVLSRAEKKGFKMGIKGKGYLKILAYLQNIRVIGRGDYKDLNIPPELRPLIEDILRSGEIS